MYELKADAYHDVQSLVTRLSHAQQVLARAMLDGNHMGRIFVDDPAAPTSALFHPACDYLILAGDADNVAFNQAWRVALTAEMAPGGWLFFMDPGETWGAVVASLFTGAKLHNVLRYTFTLNEVCFQAHANWRDTVPAGYQVRLYDRELAAGAEILEPFWGNLDNFLANGVGVAALHGEQVVSRCHSVFVGAGAAEIDIMTEAAYRRRGLATLAARAFLAQCVQRGLEPAWSCWHDNVASAALAEHLGFVRGPDVPMVLVAPTS